MGTSLLSCNASMRGQSVVFSKTRGAQQRSTNQHSGRGLYVSQCVSILSHPCGARSSDVTPLGWILARDVPRGRVSPWEGVNRGAPGAGRARRDACGRRGRVTYLGPLPQSVAGKQWSRRSPDFLPASPASGGSAHGSLASHSFGVFFLASRVVVPMVLRIRPELGCLPPRAIEPGASDCFGLLRLEESGPLGFSWWGGRRASYGRAG